MKICAQCGTRFSEPVPFCPHDGTPTQDDGEVPAPDPLLGRVIDGRYRVERVIGEGGMGVVYQVSHAVLGKRMALKVLRGSMAKDAEVVQRFVQEARSATAIGHPNIIDISDFGRLPDGSVYFAMEYLDGEPLSKLIARGGSIPMSIALHIIRQIASALEAAHARGIVHRDLKPDNIYLIRQGQDEHFVKVLDFGIAKVGGSSSKLTRTGMIFGTPHYMSPEQAAGQSVDRRTDIYALGVIMYEMFTGAVPFDGDSVMGILAKHIFEPPVPPSKRPGGPALGAIEDVIMKALAKKVEERYQSMSELIEDLDRVASVGIPGVVIRYDGQSPPSLANALEPPSRTELRLSRSMSAGGIGDVSLPASRRPWMAVAVVAIALVGLGVGAVVFSMTDATATVSRDGASGAIRGGAATSEPGADSAMGSGTVRVMGTSTTGPVAVEASDRGTGVPSSGSGEAGGGAGGSDGAGEGPGLRAGGGPTEPTSSSTRRIQIVSDPPGASVLIDGVLVGNTPLHLPVPREGERVVRLELRGYEASRVTLSAASPDLLRVSLTPASTVSAGASRASRGVRSHRSSASTDRAPTGTGATTTAPRVGSEVVDPWAN